ncbi:hypothetical protein PQO03_17550 [Lentisphaera profundi]|uniref:STAS/SEC14 domain-containing protein n=1 Tax=Lentisphaera profundi TaxID=1658616 RepID=A0ABY7VTY2_9BACT|nr:hypothetical protein [Lentisphaera profundi]WDE97635.1 hypothetical protein PQO03_17550 [Lentisphaera profundi]
MKVHKLHFGKIIILHEDMAEVIINEGVELSLDMINQYHAFLLDNLRAPFSLLVNKIHSYTYSFEAQLQLLNLKELNFLSVVSYTRISELSTQLLAKIPRKEKWDLQIFKDRDKAYRWLCEQHKITF